MLPAWAKLADSVYFFTGSTQEAAVFALTVFGATLAVAALATPVPSTAAAPSPTARTATRVRSGDVREERDVARWNIETSRGTGTEKPPGTHTAAGWHVHW